jgi:hypothetical protein
MNYKAHLRIDAHGGSCSTGKNIPCLYSTWRFISHICFNKRLQVNPFMGQLSLVHIFIPCSFTSRFNIIVSPRPVSRSPKRSLPFKHRYVLIIFPLHARLHTHSCRLWLKGIGTNSARNTNYQVPSYIIFFILRSFFLRPKYVLQRLFPNTLNYCPESTSDNETRFQTYTRQRNLKIFTVVSWNASVHPIRA